MVKELKYVTVDLNFKDLEKIEELYTAAFPPQERALTIKQVLEVGSAVIEADIIAVYDEDVLVGFYCLTGDEGYKYIQYLAVNTAIRSKGYGGIILRKIMNENKDMVLFASIEKPIPGEYQYDIRLRRQNFYERNGMITINYEEKICGVTYIVVTNKTGEEFDRCYESEMTKFNRRDELVHRLFGGVISS